MLLRNASSSKDRTKRLQCYNRWTKLFWSTIKNDQRTYDSIWNIATGQGDYYTTGCLLDYPYFKEHSKIIAIDLSNNKNLMLIRKRYNKLVLLEI